MFRVKSNSSHRSCYDGELEKWEGWSWKLKQYVGLQNKPVAKLMTDDVEGANTVITDELSEQFYIQKTRS